MKHFKRGRKLLKFGNLRYITHSVLSQFPIKAYYIFHFNIHMRIEAITSKFRL
jgi:hypothetical protein